jgi:hypothetical protein
VYHQLLVTLIKYTGTGRSSIFKNVRKHFVMSFKKCYRSGTNPVGFVHRYRMGPDPDPRPQHGHIVPYRKSNFFWADKRVVDPERLQYGSVGMDPAF